MSEEIDDAAQLLREHFTNMLPSTRKVCERVLAELEERRKIFPGALPAPLARPPELPRADSGCQRCAEAETLVVSLFVLFRRGDSHGLARELVDRLRRDAEDLRAAKRAR
jgi:hypothetical protein